MTTGGLNARAFDALIRRAKEKDAGAARGPADLLEQFVWSFLLWEASVEDAERAMKRVTGAVVDFNELRVCMPEEVVGILGVRYPRAAERAARLKAGLHDVYLREHAVTFEPLKEKPKRVVRQYLESLASVPLFVSGRMMVVGLGGHATPLDERMLGLLTEAGVFEEGLALDKAIAALERHVKAEHALEAHLALMRACEDGPGTGVWRGLGAKRTKAGAAGRSRARRD